MNVTMAALGAAAGWILASAAATADATKQVTLGVEDDAGPWSYANGSGYANDLVKAAYAAAGWQVTLQVLPYARCKALAMAGKLAGCFSASISVLRTSSNLREAATSKNLATSFSPTTTQS